MTRVGGWADEVNPPPKKMHLSQKKKRASLFPFKTARESGILGDKIVSCMAQTNHIRLLE